MELSYMVRGGDGKEYGPVSLDQLATWIREGRLRSKQEVKRSDMAHWAPASDFAELQPLFAAAGLPSSGTAAPPVGGSSDALAGQADPGLYAQMRSGASWFYWIAGLSLVNSLSAFFKIGFGFLFGLGITQILDELAARASGGGQAFALLLDLVVAGVFVLFGFFSNKGHSWAFIVGMVLFALDGLILVFAEAWLPVAFHAFALFCIFRGFVAGRKLGTAIRA